MSDFQTKLTNICRSQQEEFLSKLPAALAAKSQSEQLLKLLTDFNFIIIQVRSCALALKRNYVPN